MNDINDLAVNCARSKHLNFRDVQLYIWKKTYIKEIVNPVDDLASWDEIAFIHHSKAFFLHRFKWKIQIKL